MASEHELFPGVGDPLPGFSGIATLDRPGAGTLLSAHEDATGRDVTLQVLSAPPAALDALRRELPLIGALGAHPNVLTLHGTLAAPDGRHVLVLESCPEAVTDRVAGGRTMPVPQVIALGIKIAGALQSAHDAGLLHRTVAPEYLLVTAGNEPVLAGLGTGLLRGPEQTAPGTLVHVAPELAANAPTGPATDVYGLASALYELLAGRPALAVYAGEPVAAVLQRVRDEPVSPLGTDVAPPELAELLQRSLAKDPAARPVDPAAFAADLARVAATYRWPYTRFVVQDARATRPETRSEPPVPPPAVATSVVAMSVVAPPVERLPEPPASADATVARSSLGLTPPTAPPPVPPTALPRPAEATVARSSLGLPPPTALPSTGPLPPDGATVARSSLALPPQPAPPQGDSLPELPPVAANETVFRSSLGRLPLASTPAPAPPPPAAAQWGPDLALDPASLRPRITVRSGTTSLVLDENRLAVRSWLRRSAYAWSDILAFEPRLDGGATAGHLLAVTRTGPVELPGTQRPLADLRYLQALLEAYRLRGTRR